MNACIFPHSLDPALTHNWAVRYSCANGHTEIVKVLRRDDRLNPAAQGEDNAAIQDASVHGHTETVYYLLADPRVNPAAKDNLAIRYASTVG